MKALLAAALVLGVAASSASATDFSVVLKDMDGHEIIDDLRCPAATDGKRACQDKLTLGRASANALVGSLPGDDNDSRAKYDRWHLAGKILHGDLVNLDAMDTTMVIKRLGMLYGPIVVGPAIDLLDPNFNKK